MRHTCHYCGNIQSCFTLAVVSELTEQALDAHFFRTSEEPSDLEYAMLRHSEHDWCRDGDPIVQVIEELLQTCPAVAQDIQQVLEEKHASFDHHDYSGQETEFAADSFYKERRKVSTKRLDSMWAIFVASLKSESRYINNSVRKTLDGIFSGLDSLQVDGEQTVITDAGPGTGVTFLYRSRWSRNQDELEKMMVTPDRELGPPPHRFSGANRMSAKGISVFYGASSVETTISEIRPPVGCDVVCAKFSLIRPLRLLNLPALKSVLDSGSMLDPDFIQKREQAAFLRSLTSRLVTPVLPGDEDFSYIPTQVIAEYLADSAQLNLDGILYPSVQLAGPVADGSYNVVLFHKASRVRWQRLPTQKDCGINFVCQYNEDEWEPDLCVTEFVQEGKVPSQPEVEVNEDELLPHFQDHREPALEVDLPSVSVHHIRAARFEYSSDSVRRERCHVKSLPVPDQSPWDIGVDPDDTPF
ncbi:MULTISPECIES: RES family NAD+ phosphorylase [Pectobacterium]|nr:MULTISPECIES: RES family NAD+ phosphorylase [Pectobacterium]UEM39914.1 RES family NAD+ phosphorylase [Pectobacterium aquaticum]